MIFFNADLDDKEIEEKLKELDEDHQREIQKRYDIGEIKNYQITSSNDGNGKTLQHHKTNYNSNKNPKEQSTKEESPHEIYSQKFVGNDYLAEAVLIGNKPYFALSIKRIFSDFDDDLSWKLLDDGDYLISVQSFDVYIPKDSSSNKDEYFDWATMQVKLISEI